ncbi:MAG: galactose-1-phosphate uridylyltransferase [Renibacterium salmoninarum]|jgi:UDPglucose--hexose-1-phosphate uridylyltransferase|nr:galactose-1-phosphate uridylyltransferase [Renibacterium salmoninarum]
MNPAMSSIRLADGRELIYFDETARPHPEPDQRPLEPRAADAAGEVRYDALTGDWVAIAAHRGNRTYLPPADQCPLCPSKPGAASEIPAADYDVAVFENRFPSLGPALGSLAEHTPVPPVWGTKSTGFGRCEVVAFTSDHQGSFGTLGPRRARTVLAALAQRTAWLSALPGIKQVFPFENRGKDVGVTLHHPHGQIYAYPYLTPRATVMAEAAAKHHERSGQVLLEHILHAEQEAGDRMVLQGDHFSAFVPFAAHWPLEVHLVPHRQVADLAGLSGPELDELAVLYLDLLHRLDSVYDSPTPYIAAWHQAPVDPGLRAVSRLHLQITSPRRSADKLKFLAGSEAAMGAFINDSTPERIAGQLREAGRLQQGSGS